MTVFDLHTREANLPIGKGRVETDMLPAGIGMGP